MLWSMDHACPVLVIVPFNYAASKYTLHTTGLSDFTVAMGTTFCNSSH